MLRVLFTIPHYYYPADQDTGHGSESAAAREARREALDLVLFQISALFDARSFAADHLHHEPLPVRQLNSVEFDIIICTTSGHHLLAELETPQSAYTHVATRADSPWLGLECHRLLKDALGRYDYYCYLEDDIVLYDPLFFAKLETFNHGCSAFGDPRPLLQPHRYEITLNQGRTRRKLLDRLYMDYTTAPHPATEMRSFTISLFGLNFTVERTCYPHAGCFFLTQCQLDYLSRQPVFMDCSKVWVTPLDTAATYAIGTIFPVYKPALDSASFLEVRHAHPNMLHQLHANSGRLVWKPPLIPGQ